MRAVLAETRKSVVSGWLWWGGDCEQCLGNCGFHPDKPERMPPLHPHCDCAVRAVELEGGQRERLEELSRRSVRLVREMNLVLGDGNISGREREEVVLCRRILDSVLREAVEAGRLEEYLLTYIGRVLADAEIQASRVKYRLSLEAANAAVEDEEDKIRGTYTAEALDKAEELDSLLRAASREFKATLRAVKAAFADEYGRRWKKDELQDKYQHGLLGLLRKVSLLNDYGLSNIDYNTAVRLQQKYSINVHLRMSLDEYLCTDEGCARFTAAAIREAQDELRDFIAELPLKQKEIMDSLNRDEKDALFVTTYKRGMEAEEKKLDWQLEKLVEKRSRQRYLYLGEGYKAWQLWITPGF